MKFRSIYIVLFIIIIVNAGRAQWFVQGIPSNVDLSFICFTDSTTGYSGGSNGAIIKTTDGGNSWFVLPSVLTSELDCISFPTKSTGYVAGSSGTAEKTTDAGISWENLNTGVEGQFYSIYFIDSLTGFIAGAKLQVPQETIVLKTTDGGNSWSRVSLSGSIPIFAYSVFFASPTIGYISGNINTLFKTTDGGNNWFMTGMIENLNLISSIYFKNLSVGFAVGQDMISYNPGIIKTTDGGNTWTKVYYGSGTNKLNSVAFIDSATGFAAGDSGLVVKTTDGGNSWSEISKPGSNTITCITGNAAGRLFASSKGFWDSNSEIIKSVDGGKKWTSLLSPPPVQSNLTSVHFLTSLTGYAVGYDGNILKTTDSGVTWTLQNSPISSTPAYLKSLDDVYFTDASTGYVIGGDSISYVFKTTDECNTWDTVASIKDNFFTKINFPSASTGFVLCYTDNLMKTTDSGNSWESIKVGDSISLSSICFINDTVGFVGGWDGIFKTIDGGNSWSKIFYSDTIYIECLFFPTPSIGYASGISGTLKTTDGGETWQGISAYPFGFNSMYFTDSETGYGIAYEGKIYKTIDGGGNWILQGKSLSSNLSSVYFADENFGVAVGYGGEILRAKNSGTIANVSDKIFYSKIIPSECLLEQNYPNPFNPITNFEFRISDMELVTLKIYNILGEKVATIINKELPAGDYKYQWDASGLASGVYIYRLRAGNFIGTKKLILMK